MVFDCIFQMCMMFNLFEHRFKGGENKILCVVLYWVVCYFVVRDAPQTTPPFLSISITSYCLML